LKRVQEDELHISPVTQLLRALLVPRALSCIYKKCLKDIPEACCTLMFNIFGYP